MFCILALYCIFEPSLYTYIALLGLRGQTEHAGRDVFVPKVTKHVSTLGRRSPWPQYERVVAFICVLHSFTLSRKLGLLGHHASRCIIDGPRVEDRAPLSSLHDRECSHAHICLKIPCHTRSPLWLKVEHAAQTFDFPNTQLELKVNTQPTLIESWTRSTEENYSELQSQ